MNKIIFSIVFFLLLLPVVFSQQDDWYYNSKNLILNVKVDSEADIVPLSDDFSISYINVNLTHIPYESQTQEILENEITPRANEQDNSYLYSWENPSIKINFGYDTTIKTTNDIIKIKAKIPFPIRNLDEELEPFTRPQPNINSDDPDIIKLASKLAEGEDDLYVVVHNIAEWTKNNIEYDLSTLTAEVSQRASWVLENKQGVCDELTSLFIAMLRSLGIPAKFVSGVAYTNSPLFPENWGSHGWAEVYFPGVGWVPYDVTYGEFAYVDPTHIKLKESLDSGEPSINYRWLARDIDLKTQKLDIDTTVEEIIGRVEKPIEVNLKLLKDRVGFGSYNLVEVELINKKDYYISSEVFIARPQEVALDSDFNKNVLLKPNERKSVFWVVRIPNNLETNFIYTFPISVNTVRNFTESTEIISQKNEIVYTYSEIQNILSQRAEEEIKTYSKDVDASCEIDRVEFYSYESADLKCSIQNIGNTLIENVDLCFDEDCKEIDLGISQKIEAKYTIENQEAGKKQFPITLKNKDIAKALYVDLNILDAPSIEIKEATAPKEVEFKELFEIEFLLSKESASVPENLNIVLEQETFRADWDFSSLPENKRLVINLKGSDLKKGENNFEIKATYSDANNNKYESVSNLQMNLVNVSALQEVFLAFNGALQRLEKLPVETLILITIGALAVFICVIAVVFFRK